MEKNNIEIDDEFIEDNDKRVIVFASLGLLIIIATVIVLLVGNQNDFKDNNENKQNKRYITPELEIDEDKEEKNISYKIVNQVLMPINDETFDITYHYNDKTYVTKSNKVDKYIPEGYSSCKYYTDKNFADLYDFNTNVSSPMNIYLSCNEIVYTIKYSNSSNNIEEYKLSDGTLKLVSPVTDLTFEGWYTDENYTNRVTNLDESIIKYSNNGTINLYAKLVKYYMINYYNMDNNIIDSIKISKEQLNDYKILDASYLSNLDNKFLGWSKEKDSMIIDYLSNETINISNDINLYSVFGSSMIIFTDNNKLLERRGLTKEDSQNFELPSEEEIKIDSPTYIVKVDSLNDSTKIIVSDDTEALLENEIKLSDVLSKKSENYDPQIGDKVEEVKKKLNWVIDKKTIDSTTGDENIEKVSNEDEIKQIIKNNAEENIDTELKTEWTEQNIE